MTVVIGIDVSLACTGYCEFVNGKLVVCDGIPTDKKHASRHFSNDFDRCMYVYNTIRRRLGRYRKISNDVHIFFEDYAYGSRMGKSFTRSEIAGSVKIAAVSKYGYSIYSINIKSLKKYITGNGNANKELMEVRTYAKYGYESRLPLDIRNNAIDAYCLARYGMSYLDGEKLDITSLIRSRKHK